MERVMMKWIVIDLKTMYMQMNNNQKSIYYTAILI